MDEPSELGARHEAANRPAGYDVDPLDAATDDAWGQSGDWVDGDGAIEPEPPAWVFEAAAENLRRDVVASAGQRPCGAVAVALELACPPPGQPSGDAGGVGPAGLDAAGLLGGIVGLSRLIGWAQAMQQRYIAALARPGVVLPAAELINLAASPAGIATPIPDLPPEQLARDPKWAAALAEAAIKVAAAEIGCALAIAPVTARKRTEQAMNLVDRLPATLAAQQSGRLDAFRAAIIAEHTAILTVGQARHVEAAVLPAAAARTPARLKDLLEKHVTAIDPAAAARRQQAARRGRHTRVDTGPAGMATFCAAITAPDAHLAQAVLDRIATAVKTAGLAAGRGQAQLRADAFTALFTDLATTGRFTITRPDRPEPAPAGTGAGGAAADGAGTDAAGTNNMRPDDAGTNGASADRMSAIGAATDGARAGGASPPANDPAGGIPSPPGPPATDRGTGMNGTMTGSAGTDGADAKGRGTDAVGSNAGVVDRVGPGRRRRARQRRRAKRQLPICVNVYVNASTLAGLDDDPAEIAGHGIITAGLARSLAESATAVRAIVTSPAPDPGHSHGRPDPAEPAAPPGDRPFDDGPAAANPRHRYCGTIFDAGTLVYRPPDRTADHVTARDRTCCFPGCRTRAQNCDLDHRKPFTRRDMSGPSTPAPDAAGPDTADGETPGSGPTCPCNLDALCRFHHLIKTFSPWRADPGDDGTLIWTAPTGARYPTEPAHVLYDNPHATDARTDRPAADNALADCPF